MSKPKPVLCGYCGIEASYQCSACGKASYCSSEHQLADWKLKHKTLCKTIISAKNKLPPDSLYLRIIECTAAKHANVTVLGSIHALLEEKYLIGLRGQITMGALADVNCENIKSRRERIRYFCSKLIIVVVYLKEFEEGDDLNKPEGHVFFSYHESFANLCAKSSDVKRTLNEHLRMHQDVLCDRAAYIHHMCFWVHILKPQQYARAIKYPGGRSNPEVNERLYAPHTRLQLNAFIDHADMESDVHRGTTPKYFPLCPQKKDSFTMSDIIEHLNVGLRIMQVFNETTGKKVHYWYRMQTDESEEIIYYPGTKFVPL